MLKPLRSSRNGLWTLERQEWAVDSGEAGMEWQEWAMDSAVAGMGCGH